MYTPTADELDMICGDMEEPHYSGYDLCSYANNYSALKHRCALVTANSAFIFAVTLIVGAVIVVVAASARTEKGWRFGRQRAGRASGNGF